MPKILVAGCGFLGEAAADFFSAEGWRVVGLTHSADSAIRLSGKPYPVRAADLALRASLATVRATEGPFDFVLHCASSGRGGAESYRRVYVDGCAHLMSIFPEARTIFTGSTSVFAQVSGEWVDENSPAEPERETGRLLLEAETLVRAAGGSVLRLSGIYGPGRSVLLRKFLDRSAILEDGGGRWINQIHRDDAVRAIHSIISSGEPSTIYNVTDDTPVTQRAIYGWIAEFLGLPLPGEGPADHTRKRGWTSKRVRNARLRALGWAPEFASYRHALPQLTAWA